MCPLYALRGGVTDEGVPERAESREPQAKAESHFRARTNELNLEHAIEAMEE